MVVVGVATDRWVGVRKSVLVDIRRLHAPTGHCASAPLLSLVTCTKLLPNFALHRLFPILHCQTSSPSTNHQPSTIHHRPPCHTMASSPLNIRASFLAPSSVAAAAKVLLELPSLLSTRPRLRRREGSGVPPSYPAQQPGQWSTHMPPTSFSPPQTTPYAAPSFMPPASLQQCGLLRDCRRAHRSTHRASIAKTCNACTLVKPHRRPRCSPWRCIE